MFSLNLLKDLSVTQAAVRRFANSVTHAAESSTGPFFFRPQIYEMLRLITLGDHGPASASLVHRPSAYKVGGSGPPSSNSGTKSLKQSKVSLLTDEELKKTLKDATLLTRQRLQMPPMLPARARSDVLIEEEPRLAGLLPTGESIVFTDVSINDHVTDRTRMMVARRSDGSLYSVNWEERDILQKTYFPLPGQRLLTPLMFEPEHLKTMLAQEKFCYILDRACVQFEPDDPIFINTRSAVFDYVLLNRSVKHIYGTRHLGPLALHAILTRRYNYVLYLLMEHSLKATLGFLHLFQRITALSWEHILGENVQSKEFEGISVDIDAKFTYKQEIIIKTVAEHLANNPPTFNEEVVDRITSIRNKLLEIDDEASDS